MYELSVVITEYMVNPSSRVAQGILITIASIASMCPQCIAIATSILTNHSVGALDTMSGPEYIQLGMIASCVYGIIAASMIYIFQSSLIDSITNSRKVQESVSEAIYMLCKCVFNVNFVLYIILHTILYILYVGIYVLINAVKGHLTYYLRLIGRPMAVYVGSSFFLMIMPLAYHAAITLHYELVGLWFVMCIAWVLAGTMYTYIVLGISWEEVIDQAEKRHSVN